MAWRVLLCAVLAGLLAGCSCSREEPKTAAELRDLAVQARADAEAARQAGEVKRARRAAERATEAAQRLAAQLEAAEDPPATDVAAGKEAADAASDAKRLADLAEEAARLADLTSGWKARAYRKTRAVALAGTFAALEAAASQAAQGDLASAPDAVQQSADAAADLAERVTGRARLPDGSHDWAGIAADMKAFRAQPPPEMAQFLALAFLLAGRNRLALYEIEAVKPAAATTPQQARALRVQRGLIYALNDLPRLAVAEIEASAVERDGGPSAPELLAGIHLALGCMHLHNRDLELADVELVRAMRVWPNNPVCVFLTGERLAAGGEHEKAAQSLEALAAGTDREWLARVIAKRARELRDERGDARPLLHDTAFLRDVVGRYVLETARDSEAMQAVRGWVASARGFGSRLLEQLPGVGRDPSTQERPE